MSDFPYPGQPVRGSQSGRPTMALFDLLGRRWSMGVLWQLSKGGCCTFRQLQSRCESISPAVLNSRIKELRQALLIEKSENGYQATALGEQLFYLLLPLSDFALQWSTQLTDSKDANNEQT